MFQQDIKTHAKSKRYRNEVLPSDQSEVSVITVSFLLGAVCVQLFGWPWRSGALPLDPPTDRGHGLLVFLVRERYWFGGRSCPLQSAIAPPTPLLKQNDIIGTGGGWGLGVCDGPVEFKLHHSEFGL